MLARVPHLLVVALSAACLHAAAGAQCEVQDLHGPSSWAEGSHYGISVDLDGDRMAIGQQYGPYIWPDPSGPGSVHLLRRDASGWVPDGTVQASDGEPGDYFGWSVALDGDRLLVGVPAIGYLATRGAAYVFERQGDGVWVQTAKFLPDQPLAWAIGWSVDLEGDTAIVGAKGAAIGLGWGRVFVYEHDGEDWVLQQELLPSVSSGGDAFGVDVDLQGERLVVGASAQQDASPPNSGLAFVFEREAGTWVETAKLIGADSQDYDCFGSGVALDGDTIVVGAFNKPPSNGAAYVFEHGGASWSQTAKLIGADLPEYWYGTFGYAVDLQGDLAVIGAYQDFSYADAAGSAYVFERDGAAWTEVAKLAGTSLSAGDSFGYAVDLEGEELLIGAPKAVSIGTSPGAAYLFSLQPGSHLLADASSVSVSQGGTQTLHVGGCPANAGDLYFVAGSATGTTPGFVAFGHAVPLNPDVYLLHTLNHPDSPPLTGSFGLLDTLGCADARFELPPTDAPALAGLVLHHAYALLDPATLQVEAVSPAVPVALVP